MTNTVILYFSGYGHTARQAEAVAEGAARVEGCTVSIHAIGQEGNLPDTAWANLAAADAIISTPRFEFKALASNVYGSCRFSLLCGQSA